MRRRFHAPEVIQTSTMDCGPAALTSLLVGCGLRVDYEQLRARCHTDVDGTSIDALTECARRAGADAETQLVPFDLVFEPATRALPALCLTVLPGGGLHTVVLWRTYGPLVQIMDPAHGRRWMTKRELLDHVYAHRTVIPSDELEAWIRAPSFQEVLRSRIHGLGGSASEADAMLAEAASRPGRLATLDAAVRVVHRIRRPGACIGRRAAIALVRDLFARASAAPRPTDVIPPEHWVGLPSDSDAGEVELARFAVLLVVRGRAATTDAELVGASVASASHGPRSERGSQAHELRRLFGIGRGELGAAAVLALGVACVEPLLLAVLVAAAARGTTSIVGLVLVLGGAAVAIELALASLLARLGRKLEARLLDGLSVPPQALGEQYFASRPRIDTAERCHGSDRIREVPHVARRFVVAAGTLLATLVGLLWLMPGWEVLAVAGVALAGSALSMVADEGHLRARSLEGTVSHRHLDLLRGWKALRPAIAQRTVRHEYAELLSRWARTRRGFASTLSLCNGVQLLVCHSAIAWLVAVHHARTGELFSTLVFAYWLLVLPRLVPEVVAYRRAHPELRNLLLRLAEPLRAAGEPALEPRVERDSVHLALEHVVVEMDGVPRLDDLSLEVRRGEHVAIVGNIGSGTSVVAELVLGWARPDRGSVLIDGVPASRDATRRLREHTAWVSPDVALWDESLRSNVYRGAAAEHDVVDAVEHRQLRPLVERLPAGAETRLGEAGRVLSAGERQRVRLARALLRGHVRLALLEDGCHGIPHAERAALLELARATWRHTTLIAIGQHATDALSMPRVVVLERGRIVEDGAPAELAARDSRYRAMLNAETLVREAVT